MVLSRSFRTGHIPKNIIVMYNANGTLPSGYSHECTLFSKYTKGVPTACTNPGSCDGADTHTEAANNLTHNHTGAASGCDSHSHTLTSAGFADCAGVSRFTGLCQIAKDNHTHTFSGCVTSPSLTVGCTTICHTHASANIEPLFGTLRHIKYTDTVIRSRRRSLPQSTIIYYNKALSTIPCHWQLDTSLVSNRFTKGVANACACVGGTGGASTHSHAADGGHIHLVSLACHTHGIACTSGGASANADSDSGCTSGAAAGHSHSKSTVTISCATSGNACSSSNTHTHTAENNLPVFTELAYLKPKSISIRRGGVPNFGIVEWLCTLASIPSGFALADGTNCTENLINRYPRETPNACTNPGSTGGNATHTHTDGGHTHTACTPTHSHGATGSTGTPSGTDCRGGCANNSTNPTHTHGGGSTSCTTQAVTTACLGGHNHGSKSNNPSSKEVAFIQRL